MSRRIFPSFPGSRPRFFIAIQIQYLKKQQNVPRPSEHPPVRGGKIAKTFRWDQRLQIQNLFMAFKRVVEIALGQQYNVGEKPTVILYTYINRHAGTPEKTVKTKQRRCSTPSHMVVIIYYYIGYKYKVTTSTWYLRLHYRSTPVAQSAPRNLLTRWDVSSIPANGIFLTKN